MLLVNEWCFAWHYAVIPSSGHQNLAESAGWSVTCGVGDVLYVSFHDGSSDKMWSIDIGVVVNSKLDSY